MEGFGSQSSGLPRIIKILLIVNVGIFLLDYLTNGTVLTRWFAMNPYDILVNWQFWRVGTYMFLHSVQPPVILHILFNMLILWMFGTPVAYTMGEKKMLNFYLAGGVFSGICALIFYTFTNSATSVVGASGAIFAVMVAFAKYFPRHQILMFFLFPMEARWVVLIYGAIDLLLIMSQDGVAHIAHLGGAVFALLYFQFETRLQGWWERWRNRREIASQKAKEKNDKDMEKMMVDIDPILKKISENGIQSLSPQEKKLLQKASELKKKQKSKKIIDIDEYRDYRDSR